MPLFAAHNPARGCRLLLEEQAPRSSLPEFWRALCAMYDARLKRAGNELARAKHDVHRACEEQRRAQAEAARLQDRADDLEREWHRAWRYREAKGRDIHGARAARVRLEALLAKRAQDVRAYAQATAEMHRALAEAQQRFRTIARKEAKFRVLVQRLEPAGHE